MRISDWSSDVCSSDLAKAMLAQIVAEKWLTAKAVVGLWPAQAEGDDVVIRDSGLGTGDSEKPQQKLKAKSGTPVVPGPETTLHFLRQQAMKPIGERANFCLDRKSTRMNSSH